MRKHEIDILKKSVIGAILLLGFFIYLGCYIHYKKYHFVDKGKLVAKIGSYKIYEKDLESRLSFFSKKFKKDVELDDLDGDVIKAILLENYVNDKVFYLAEKRGELNDSKFLRDEYYKKLVVKRYIESFIFSNITEKEIEERYEELVKSVEDKEEREIFHILLPTEEEAIHTLNQVMFSGNFESVAERKSIDKASAAHGGSIGYVIKEQIAIPEFANIAFLLKEGEISKPIKTKEGWHIVKVNSVRMVQPRGYEASRGDILETLKKEKYNQFLGGLKLDKMEKKIVLIGKTRVEWDKSAMTEEENAE